MGAGQTLCIVSSGGTLNYTSNLEVGNDGQICIYAENGNINLSGTVDMDNDGIINFHSASGFSNNLNGSWQNAGGGSSPMGYVNNFGDLSWGNPLQMSFLSKLTFSNFGNLRFTNSLLGTTNFAGDATLNNSGTVTFSQSLSLSSGDIFNSGDIFIPNGNIATSVNSSFTNVATGTMTVGGDVTLNGDYEQFGAVILDGTLTINANGSVNLSGGYFETGNLTLNGGQVITNECCWIIVENISSVTSSNFEAVGQSSLLIQDLSTPGGVDVNNCPDEVNNCNIVFTTNAEGDCAVLLPIELTNFHAASIGNQMVEVTWETASEVNNDYFEVFRSVDLKNWEFVQRVDGAGNSTEFQSYSIRDWDPYAGQSYYKMVQVDFDGQSSTSPIRSVFVPTDRDSDLVIYPNPSSKTITVSGDEQLLRNLEFVNGVGQKIDFINLTSIGNSITFDVSSFESGVYFLKTGHKLYKIIRE